MVKGISYSVKNDEFNSYKKCDIDKQRVFTITDSHADVAYTYEDAIDLTGNGAYNYGLLGTLVVVTLGMGVDMFGFAVVVAGSVCDLKLDHHQTGILMSIQFAGPIIMSYVWGYVSDTRGRKYSLIVAMFGAFTSSAISAFAPTWEILAVLKLITSSFSSCAQSVSYALLSESCCQRVRGSYMLLMTSMLLLTPCTFYVIGYFVLKLTFSYNLGFITFTPWRLLAILLALPLGLAALFLCFYHESPKFLLNIGREEEALEVLNSIWRTNGGEKDKYVVKKLVLNEDGNKKHKDISIMRSLWNQTMPLFKPPYILRTLQLFYLTAIMYSTNNSFSMWFPFIVNAFFASLNSASKEDTEQGLCNAIVSQNNDTTTTDQIVCTSTLELQTTVSSIAQSVICAIINIILSRFASKKKTMMITILFLSTMSALGTMTFSNNIASFVVFIGVLCICLCIGLVFSYFIDLYPTSHRGMVACLGVMVARLSALGGTYLVGAFVMTHCSSTFYIWTAYIFSGVVVACFLPSDTIKKK